MYILEVIQSSKDMSVKLFGRISLIYVHKYKDCLTTVIIIISDICIVIDVYNTKIHELY
jgi:hypothetical protein